MLALEIKWNSSYWTCTYTLQLFPSSYMHNEYFFVEDLSSNKRLFVPQPTSLTNLPLITFYRVANQRFLTIFLNKTDNIVTKYSDILYWFEWINELIWELKDPGHYELPSETTHAKDPFV